MSIPTHILKLPELRGCLESVEGHRKVSIGLQVAGDSTSKF